MNTNTQKKKQEETIQQTTSPTGGYVESEAVRLAKENLSSLQKPGAYQSSWQKNLDDVIGKIQNREKFSYDLNGDALYQQYKDQYVTQGQQAMMDTMGQAAAMTGGYGNSFAQTAGQQTYQGYLQGLNDKVPELYQLALDKYNREGDELYNQYGLLSDRESIDYGRYRDTVSDYNTERGYLTDQYNTERDFDYGKYADERDYTYQVARDAVADKQWQDSFDRGVYEFDTTFDYQKGRDSVADTQWQAQFDESVRQFDTSTILTREQMAIQQDQINKDYETTMIKIEKDYEIADREIREKVRHNEITEGQAAEELKLAQEQLKLAEEEAKNDYIYKMASLGKSSGSSGSGNNNSGNNNNNQSNLSGAEAFMDTLVRTLEKTSAGDQRNARSTILNEINKAQKAGAITAEEAAELKKKYAPTGSSGGRYTY